MHTPQARMCFQSQPGNTPSIQLHSTTSNTGTRPSTTSVGTQHTTLTGHVPAWLPHHQTTALSKRVKCSITPPPLPHHTHFGSVGGLIASLHTPAAQLTVHTELVSSSYNGLPCFITLLLLHTARPLPLAADAAGAVPVMPLPPRPALLLDAGCCGCNQRSQLPCC